LQQETTVLTRVVLVDEATGEERMLDNWFFLDGSSLVPLGTPDRQQAERRASYYCSVRRGFFELMEGTFTDEGPMPHQTEAQEDFPCW
jgi:hypothetical protein